jgi:hypothetical protein
MDSMKNPGATLEARDCYCIFRAPSARIQYISILYKDFLAGRDAFAAAMGFITAKKGTTWLKKAASL